MEPIIRCPENSFVYNSTLCACNPGYYYRRGAGGCVLFEAKEGDWAVGSGVGTAGVPASLLEGVLPLDSLERVVRSEKALVRAALVVVLLWLSFCAAVRFGGVDGGRSLWFRFRWWVSRLDVFTTKHELGDNRTVTKRRTELGGTFSIASWIFFILLFSALLYQLIMRRSIEVHSVRPSSATDVEDSLNYDFEFNITTISSMSCSQLQHLSNLTMFDNGLLDYKILPLSTYANYSCYNTSWGPTISLKSNNCQVPTQRSHYVTWQFVDHPNHPALAVGFRFNLSAKSQNEQRHMSYVSGTLDSGSYLHNRAVTLRGSDHNILKIHLFQQKFPSHKSSRLIQPLVHDFLPGSYFGEPAKLKASLQGSQDGSVNVALCISFPSDYIVEIDKENIFGVVVFLSDVGGLYTCALVIFLCLLVQCESRIKKLQSEDCLMRDIRRHWRAQKHWDKLRIYVRYRWGSSNLNVRSRIRQQGGSSVAGSFIRRIGSLHMKKQTSRVVSVGSQKVFSTSN